MHKINELLKEATDMLWSIKRRESTIEFKDLIDFYKEYQFNNNLTVDAINAMVIQYDGYDMPFSEEDISFMIDAFIAFNKYGFNRLIIETLFVLNTKKAYEYLNKILDTDEKRIEFKKEFSRWTHYEKTREELNKLGNNI